MSRTGQNSATRTLREMATATIPNGTAANSSAMPSTVWPIVSRKATRGLPAPSSRPLSNQETAVSAAEGASHCMIATLSSHLGPNMTEITGSARTIASAKAGNAIAALANVSRSNARTIRRRSSCMRENVGSDSVPVTATSMSSMIWTIREPTK